MKKLFAILLSMLLLCSMIPFATVSAAGDYYIELVADAEEVNAGDEFTVEVSLYGHESVGLIAALVELGYDHDVFEPVTYYDEDEEMWMPGIEVGPKFSASSNKYITFGPIDEETGEAKNCTVLFKRATATATQAVKTNLFYTATFRVKDDAPSGTYTIDFINYNKKNIVFHGNTFDEWTWEPITITVNGSEPAGCEHEYEYDCSKNCSKCGEETRPEAEHEFFNDCETVCMICYQEVREASHNVIHVEAKAPTCTAGGNIEYWYCDACGAAWLNAECTMPTNLRAVNLPMAEHTYFDDCSAICDVCGYEREVSHNIIHVAPVAATCTTDGNIEYWYCDACGAAWLDAECTLNTNLRSVILPASCSYNAVRTPAKDATCYEPGNVEYWYCANCDMYYLDEACAFVTNAKSVVTPISHNIIHVAPVAATCTTDGNIEYWYCDICGQAWLDEYCHQNTNLKSVILPASCSYNAEYVEAKEANCFEPGNVEYWYCANCDVYYADAACAIVTNAKNVIIPITHKIEYVAPVAATCTTDGNIEYWYCTECGAAWLDELCHLPTNLKSVILPASCSYNAVYTEAKAPTCAENGNTEYWYCANCDVYYADAACAMVTNSKNVIIPALPHTYDDDMDVDCNVCGDIRVVKYEVKTYGGKSFMESADGLSGLAFRFDLTDKIQGLAVKDGYLYVADYTNATVTPDSTGTYKLVKMGALVSNGVEELNVTVKKVILSDTEAFYAIRIINIPEDKYDTVIECTPYFVYEDANGKNVTVYGETVSGSVNG